jgi:hypothetical protein
VVECFENPQIGLQMLQSRNHNSPKTDSPRIFENNCLTPQPHYNGAVLQGMTRDNSGQQFETYFIPSPLSHRNLHAVNEDNKVGAGCELTPPKRHQEANRDEQ